jgi:hypothetical protein
MSTWRQLLSRVDGVKYVEALHRADEFIRLNNLESVGQEPVINSAAEVLSLWQVRQKISLMTGVSIPGVQVLIRNLKELSKDSEVEQFGFTGDEQAGSLFFDRRTGAFLGDTIVARRAKSRQMLDLEERSLQPSRKSA